MPDFYEGFGISTAMIEGLIQAHLKAAMAASPKNQGAREAGTAENMDNEGDAPAAKGVTSTKSCIRLLKKKH